MVDVLPADALGAHAVIGIEDLQRGGQVVVHKLADLRQAGRIGLDPLEDLGANVLHAVDAGGDLLIADRAAQPLHLGDGGLAVRDHLVQLCVAGGFFLHRLVRHLLFHGCAHQTHHKKDHCRRRGDQQKMAESIEREQQGINHPHARCGIEGHSRLALNGCHGPSPPFVS